VGETNTNASANEYIRTPYSGWMYIDAGNLAFRLNRLVLYSSFLFCYTLFVFVELHVFFLRVITRLFLLCDYTLFCAKVHNSYEIKAVYLRKIAKKAEYLGTSSQGTGTWHLGVACAARYLSPWQDVPMAGVADFSRKLVEITLFFVFGEKK
jgi:hypothetical protein